MKNKKLVLSVVPFAVLALAGCGGKKTDVTLVVYNWAHYIYEGTDDDGNLIDKIRKILRRKI